MKIWVEVPQTTIKVSDDTTTSETIKTFCNNLYCNKELPDGGIPLLHADGTFRSYCNECVAKKVNVVYSG